jgi:peptidoglycan-associated lipoprotein
LPADETVLRQIGECFSTGPLHGRELMLVGRADPRGTVEYNDALGERRASNVASFLTNTGISRDRIEVTSRGKLDAVGRDEAGWAIDRRVDVILRRE